MRARRIIYAALPALLLSACTTENTVRYVASGPTNPAPGSVQVGAFMDKRGFSDPKDYGTIRGGFGNPLKHLSADRPVKDAIARVFADALAQRGILAPANGGRYEIRADVIQFEANRFVRLDAYSELRMQVVEVATGRTVYTDKALANRTQGNILALDNGVLASTTELSALADAVLGEVVDKLLNNPAFLRAIAPPGASGRAPGGAPAGAPAS